MGVVMRRLGCLALAFITLMATLSACAVRSTQPIARPVIITFACYGYEKPTYQAVARAFNEINPDIKVQVISIERIISPSPDEASLMPLVYQLASRADTFLWWEEAVEAGPRGYLFNLSPFIEKGQGPKDNDFLPHLMERFNWGGGIWGLPAGVEPYLIFYDKRAFDEAGLEPPPLEWDWEELLTKAEKLTKRDGKETIRYGFVDLTGSSIQSLIFAKGGLLVNTSVTPPVPSFTEPRTMEAVRLYADLVLSRGIMPNPIELKGMLSPDLNGRAAMWVGLPRLWSSLSQARPGTGIAPLPEKSPLMVKGYFISTGTSHPQEAWRWLQFLSRNVAPPDMLPARKELLQDSSYAEGLGKEMLIVSRYAVEHSLPPIRPAIVWRSFYRALENILKGDDVEKALVAAEEKAANAIIEELNEAPKPIVVATPEPESEAEVSIIFFGMPSWKYEPLAEEFHKLHPDISVEVIGWKPGEVLQISDAVELIRTVKADCYLLPTLGLPPEEAHRVVLNLNPLIQSDPSFSLEDYYPQALEAVSYEGKLWGIPAQVAINVLYYNTTLFNEANLPYPKPEWGWEDFIATVKRLSGEESENKHWGLAAREIELLFILEAMSGGLVDDLSSPNTFQFNAPRVIEAARALAELGRASAIVHYRDISTDLGAFPRDWRIGMWLGIYTAARGFNTDNGIAPLPRGRKCIVGQIFDAFYISADTPHPKACWEWIKYLSGQILDPPPPRRSLIESEFFREKAGKTAQMVFSKTLECENSASFKNLEGLPRSAEAYRFLHKALEEIVWEGADVQTALTEAQRKADAYVDCLRRSENPKAAADACFRKVEK